MTLLKRLKCLVGWHHWHYKTAYDRMCLRCLRTEFNMGVRGDTDWVKYD